MYNSFEDRYKCYKKIGLIELKDASSIVNILIHDISTYPHKIVNTSITFSNTSLLRREIRKHVC